MANTYPKTIAEFFKFKLYAYRQYAVSITYAVAATINFKNKDFFQSVFFESFTKKKAESANIRQMKVIVGNIASFKEIDKTKENKSAQRNRFLILELVITEIIDIL